MVVTSIPQDRGGVIGLAQKILAALVANTVPDVAHHDAAAVSTDLYDVIGQPGPTPTPGKLGVLNLKRDELQAAAVERRSALDAARVFLGDAIDVLKKHLGRIWNPRWQAAGFTGGSLMLPYDPLPRVLELRGYFLTHLTHQIPATQITAARADELAAAVNAAVHAEGVARAARNDAATDLEEALDRLASRIAGVRRELTDLLPSDDQRWLTFGFTRPSDRRQPKKVASITLRLTGVIGEVIVQWERATGADNYRVSRQVLGLDPGPLEIGLFTDRTAILSSLPIGQTVRVSVTARNAAGETLPTTGSILIPGATT